MHAPRSRPGFTLVELLVVLALMLLLMTLTVAVVSRIENKGKVTQAASQLQGWLLLAKQSAMRDQTPRGLRLNSAGGPGAWNQVVSFSYIEQPDDFVSIGNSIFVTSVVNVPPKVLPPPAPAPFLFSPSPSNPQFWSPQFQGGVVVTSTSVDFSGGFYTGTPVLTTKVPLGGAFWPVQIGDLIEFGGGKQAQVFPIVDIQSSASLQLGIPGLLPIALITGPPSNTANADPHLPSSFGSSDYRIIRQPRPKVGEQVLQFAAGAVVDLTVNNGLTPVAPNPAMPSGYGSPLPTAPNGNLDILFSPAGTVISTGLGSGDIKLWVRDATADPPVPGDRFAFGGDQFIVTVSLRTGMISIQPVDVTPSSTLANPNTAQPSSNGVPVYNDPYSFTRDGKYSGM